MNAASPEIDEPALLPAPQLPVHAFAGCTDEDRELLLRNIDLGAVIFAEGEEPPREARLQGKEARLLHALAHPADPVAEELDEADRDRRPAFEKTEEIAAPKHEKLAPFDGHGVRGARPAVEKRDLAEHVTWAEKVESQALARACASRDPDLPAAHGIERVARIALEKERLLARGATAHAKPGD